jgi:hypothetical protein
MRNLFTSYLVTTTVTLASFSSMIFSTEASAVYFSGKGHFGLRGETRTEPGFREGTGTYQAIDRSFSLDAEAKINDKASIFFSTKFWDNPSDSFYGDNATNNACSNSGESCATASSTDNSYSPFGVMVDKAYLNIGTEYCLLNAGRRGRDWGMGMYLDSGSDPFEKDASVFEGFACDINLQKTQTLGFSVGYDKISEGSPFSHSDDLEQYFLTVELDDRKSGKSSFAKHVAIYLANITSGTGSDLGDVEYKVFDLYAALYLGNINFMTEAMFRTGKSEESIWAAYGGSGSSKHSVDSIAIALRAEMVLMSSGNVVGIEPYQSGSSAKHLAFVEFFRAPGDSDGYFKGTDASIGSSYRDSSAEAFAFHTNFKPAMVLFNGRSDSSDMNIDGVYHNDRIMNASVFTLGYKYESLENGTFEAKFISANMLETIPEEVESYFDSNTAPTDYYTLAGLYPVGYFGSDIGTEIDVSYSMKLGKSLDLTIAGAYAMPGQALRVTDSDPASSSLLQTSLTMDF